MVIEKDTKYELCKHCWANTSCNEGDLENYQTEGCCMKKLKLNYLFNQALVPENLRRKITLTTDADKTDRAEFVELNKIAENSVEFVNNGNNLYIFSPISGNGKTSWALRILQHYFNTIWPTARLSCKALFINVPRLLISLKENIDATNEYAEHIKENIMNADLVIWDDIGTKAATVFESENLFSMIDTRLSLGKANIFTSNLSYEELHDSLGDRLASRVYNSSKVIEFKGKDKRGLIK